MLCLQAERELKSKLQHVEDLEAKNTQLQQKLEATHSELTQKAFDAQKDSEKVGTDNVSFIAYM